VPSHVGFVQRSRQSPVFMDVDTFKSYFCCISQFDVTDADWRHALPDSLVQRTTAPSPETPSPLGSHQQGGPRAPST